ncbi:MAG TPA: signal peptidase I [Longimicrobium sp.]|nr:signal peptidase I [Longimicrobium sp.]
MPRSRRSSAAPAEKEPERTPPETPGTAARAALAGGRRAQPAQSKEKPEKPRNEVVEWIKSIVIALVLFLFIRTFLLMAYSIPSESMEDSLLVGDFLMANNTVFGATLPFTDVRLPAMRDPRRGEIVVFRPAYNEPRLDVVKRVIGIPGDTLQMVGGVVIRNGRRLNEPYAHYDTGVNDPIGFNGSGLMDPTVRPEMYGAGNHLALLLPSVNRDTYAPLRNDWGPLVVPPGKYWLMGDNRDQSLDSRFMGPVPREVIRGKPLFIYYSYDKHADKPVRFLTAARWRRIGKRIR